MTTLMTAAVTHQPLSCKKGQSPGTSQRILLHSHSPAAGDHVMTKGCIGTPNKSSSSQINIFLSILSPQQKLVYESRLKINFVGMWNPLPTVYFRLWSLGPYKSEPLVTGLLGHQIFTPNYRIASPKKQGCCICLTPDICYLIYLAKEITQKKLKKISNLTGGPLSGQRY